MTRRNTALLAGSVGLAVAFGIASWLQSSSDAPFPAIPTPETLAPAPAPPFPAPAPAANPAVPRGNPAVPDQLPRTESSAPSAPLLRGPDELRRAEAALDPAERLQQRALAAPNDPRGWMDLGRYWLDHDRRDAGQAALVRALRASRAPADRGDVMRIWRQHKLPEEHLSPAAPATRSAGPVDAPLRTRR